MKGWKEVNIGSLGEVITGNTPLTSNRDFYGGPYPFIKPTDMEIDRRHVESWDETYSEKAFLKYKNAFIPKGATGVVTIGTVGEKLFQANQPCFTNQSVNVVIPEMNKYDYDFVYYLMKYNLPQVSAANPGTASGRHHVSKSNFCAIKVWVPNSLPTQRRIASILSAYDDLIENNLKRIKLLEELAQRTYEEWFVKLRINGEPLPIDEKTGLPEGWEKRPLNEIAEIISGFAFKSGDYVKDGKYKIVTIKNVQDGCFIPETTDSLTEVPRKVKQSQILKSGDIILSLTGNVGRTCLVFGQNYLLNQRVAKLVAKRPEHYSFIYFLLRSKAMVVALENLSNGAAQQNLSPINMGNYLVALPDDEVLNRYSNQFNNHIDLICQLNNEITLLKESRDILLPRLMSGKINVE